MYIEVVPNRRARPTILLRESYREAGKVKKRTLANLSRFPLSQVETLRRALRGEALVPADSLFEVIESKVHGPVDAVRLAMQRLGFANLIASQRSRERDLVLALVAARMVAPDSKLATSRWWETTTIPEEFGVSGADEDELYAAMDWLVKRQGTIERKLARRHLQADGLMLYDVSSSYVEGRSCPLARLGHNRDGKKGKLQVNYGLLTDGRGCPVAVSVFPGNTADATTVAGQVKRAREEFGIERVAVVGDRGMISGKQIKELRGMGEVEWVTALRSGEIRKLVRDETVKMSLFDERGLCEIVHPDFPDERLIVCRNPLMAERRAWKREALLEGTMAQLEKVRGMVERGRLKGKEKIGVRVGRVVNRYKMAKHMELLIEDDAFSYRVKEESVKAEAALDGLYVIRTNVPCETLGSAEAVRRYKGLAQVEEAFRSLKSIDLKLRPIYHYLERRVRAHIFLCLLAYYVAWHMKRAWRELLFSDEEEEKDEDRDPVAPARRSSAALDKVHRKQLEDGTPVHSFRTLLRSLGTIVKDTCHRKGASVGEPCFFVVRTPNPAQNRALALLHTITL